MVTDTMTNDALYDYRVLEQEALIMGMAAEYFGCWCKAYKWLITDNSYLGVAPYYYLGTKNSVIYLFQILISGKGAEK